MKRAPAAAFVVSVSLLATIGCKKESDGLGECKPPDCHANPPGTMTAPPEPTPTPKASEPDPNFHINPPPQPTPTPTINANPPAIVDAGAKKK
jgi:hypothetical protein